MNSKYPEDEGGIPKMCEVEMMLKIDIGYHPRHATTRPSAG